MEKIKNKKKMFCLLGLTLLFILSTEFVIAKKEDLNLFNFEKVPKGKIENPSRGVYKIGNAIADQNNKLVKIKGKINEVTWVDVEYLAVGKKGKAHESIIVLDVEPLHLNIALILIGLKGGKPLKYQGDPDKPKGDSVEIFVEWNTKGKKKRIRAEELVFDEKKKKQMEKTSWVYTGSRFDVKNRFMSQITHSIIAVFHDPDAIIDNPLKGGGVPHIYKVNKKKVPKPGTEIEMIIKSRKSRGSGL